MDREEIKEALLAMFPKLTREQARGLAATGDDISVLVTRVLDNNIDAPSVPIREIAWRGPAVWSYSTPYNYPEVFRSRFRDVSACVEDLRKEAAKLFRAASAAGQSALGHPIKPARTHYSIEADELRSDAEVLNRRAAMLLMRRSLESGGPVDLHGLFVNECLGFLDDLLRFYRFREVVLVTGRKYNSSKLRPAVEEWLIKNHFSIIDEGPALRGIKKSPP